MKIFDRAQHIRYTGKSQNKRAYVQALQDYWNFFYNIRSLTLFDFIKRKPLETDYDKLIQ